MNLSYLKKIFLILFLDLFAYSAIIPLLPVLFLDSNYFLSSISSSHKVIYLGLLYATYPLFQTLCAPFWAKIADRIGRRKMLQISFLGNCLGYLISSFGVFDGSFVYLILGNAVSGCLGVNISTINALISDFTEGKKRIKYFGLVNLMLGLAFSLGPFLISLLIPKVPHVETIALFIFLAASFLALCNFFLVSSLKAPLVQKPQLNASRFDIKSLKKEAFHPLIVMFLTTFGWYVFIKTFQIFLLESGRYQSSDVLKFVSFYGVSTVIAQAVFVTGLFKRFSYKTILNASLFGLASSISLFVITPGFLSLHVHILAIAFFQSMIMPNLLGFFSKNHTPEVHGQMMSAHLGIVSLAKILAPALSGLVMSYSPGLSLVFSSCVLFSAALMLPLLFKEKTELSVEGS
jgi:MFS family permease